VLGDIVNGQPTYVRAPFSLYGDPGYAAFKAANAGRTPMLYVPGNDGMLHAFYAGTSTTDTLGGKEAWAVIPSMMLPKLYRLADNNYKDNHAYFVDGTPSVSDMFDTGSGTWKTILVAGSTTAARATTRSTSPTRWCPRGCGSSSGARPAALVGGSPAPSARPPATPRTATSASPSVARSSPSSPTAPGW
jgi:hypothetical protein